MDKKRRRYTLDQIEREEFKETETEISEPEVGFPFYRFSSISEKNIAFSLLVMAYYGFYTFHSIGSIYTLCRILTKNKLVLRIIK